jgi:colicin import membrane protein
MNAAADRLEFAPPPTPGLLRAVGLAILVHAFLLAALTWGVHWKRNSATTSAEAELWAAVPQQAAPPPLPVAAPARLEPPSPVPQATPNRPDPEIALERERQRVKKEKQAADRAEHDKRELQLRKVQEKQRELERQRALEKQRELDQRQAADKQKSAQDAKRKDDQKAQQEESRKLEAQRRANLQRMAGLAGSSGTPAATGTAAQSVGPTAGYGGRVVGKIRPNIVYTGTLATNPEAVVEVRTAPDGTIVSRKLVKSSGTKSWDDAVLKAIDKSETLPRDVDGRVPPVLEISFRPRD